MIYSPQPPNFKALGQGVHENGLSYFMKHEENEIPGIPLEYDMNRGFPISVASPDDFNSNLTATVNSIDLIIFFIIKSMADSLPEVCDHTE